MQNNNVLTWTDVFKLTVPFVTAILMVWIKSWIENANARRVKQSALARLIIDELRTLHGAVGELIIIAQTAAREKLRLVSLHMPSLITKLASDLSELDPQNSYYYSEVVSNAELVAKGLARLNQFVQQRAAGKDGESHSLDRAIHGQAEITASDIITYGKATLVLLEKIPRKNYELDDQGMSDLRRSLSEAEGKLTPWPPIS